jgi:molybdate transport system substrate-binding protein
MPCVRLTALVVLVSAAVVAAAQPHAPPLAVAAASDLQSVLPALASRFEQESSRPVMLTFGSSGNFFSQIQNGAPFDLFFSADVDYPRRLEAAGLTEPGTLQPYAIGRLVLYASTAAKLGPGLDLRRGLAVLTDARVRRIAIANPEHAPYGRAAVAALTHERLFDQVRAKLVLGENVSQAAQFVQSGNAQAGLIALSLARAPALRASGTYVEVPASFYPTIEQAAVVIRASSRKDAARQFLAFLARPEIAQILDGAGFLPPPPAGAAR